jgi:hypothetical protein
VFYTKASFVKRNLSNFFVKRNFFNVLLHACTSGGTPSLRFIRLRLPALLGIVVLILQQSRSRQIRSM